MIIGFLKEEVGEQRVALTPESVRKLATHSVCVEAGAGEGAGYSDDAFHAVGCEVLRSRKAVLEKADVWVLVSSVPLEDLRYLKKNAFVVGMLDPLRRIDAIKALARLGATALALEWLPRITRAQTMDPLSSQSNLVGYQAVVLAAAELGRAFPMMMTAAGSVPPARVLVVGAGVAGLQAIATAKRLGAVVAAFDVRAAAKEQVESLGARFIEVPAAEDGEGQGGYAKEMDAAYQQRQERALADVLGQQDVVITTAQIPNKPAPKILTEALLARMQPGSLVLDLAAATGGNCAVSQPDAWVEQKGVRIFAPTRLTNAIAHTSSKLYGANVAAFLNALLPAPGGAGIALDDPIVRATLLTHAGAIAHPALHGL